MINDSYIRLLVMKYVTGSLTDEEAVRLARWVGESPENERAYKEEVRNMASQMNSSSDAAEFWVGFRERNIREFDGKKKERVHHRWIFSVAAGIAVVVGLTLFMTLADDETPLRKDAVAEEIVKPFVPVSEPQSVNADVQEGHVYTAETGKILRVTLADGTKVILNSDSRLKISKSFNRSAREVFLDGEAFFDVAKDSTRLFIIRCGEQSYIVRGTSFNITSYSEDDYSVATLHEGALEARVRRDIIKLEPGEELRVDDRLSSVSRHKVNVANSTGWINSARIVFEDTPLRHVASRLARKYQVTINVQPEIGNIPYTGTNEDESIEDVLMLLEITSPIPLAVTHYNEEYYISKK